MDPHAAHRTCAGCLQDARAWGSGGLGQVEAAPADGMAQPGSLDRP